MALHCFILTKLFDQRLSCRSWLAWKCFDFCHFSNAFDVKHPESQKVYRRWQRALKCWCQRAGLPRAHLHLEYVARSFRAWIKWHICIHSTRRVMRSGAGGRAPGHAEMKHRKPLTPHTRIDKTPRFKVATQEQLPDALQSRAWKRRQDLISLHATCPTLEWSALHTYQNLVSTTCSLRDKGVLTFLDASLNLLTRHIITQNKDCFK